MESQEGIASVRLWLDLETMVELGLLHCFSTSTCHVVNSSFTDCLVATLWLVLDLRLVEPHVYCITSVVICHFWRFAGDVTS